jgi:hypothetical protein
MPHYNQLIKNKATARQLVDYLKRNVLEAEELAGLVAIEDLTPYGEADNEHRFDAFVVAALSQVTGHVGELEEQLETLHKREHPGANEFDEGVISGGSPSEDGMVG